LKILNKPTLIFLFVIFILFFGIVEFLQSPIIADLVSEHITKNVLAKKGLKVEFEKVDLKVFPPTTYFSNVNFFKEDKGKGTKVRLDAKRIGFHFGLLDFFSSKFIVSKISLYDAEVKVNFKIGNKKTEKIAFKDIKELDIEKYLGMYKTEVFREIPFVLRELELDEVTVHLNDLRFLLDKINFKLFKRSFELSGRLEEFKYLKLKNWKNNEQELDFNFRLTKDKIDVKNLSFKNREDRINFKGEITEGKAGPMVNGWAFFIGRIENFSANFDFLKGITGLVDAKVKLSNRLIDPDAKLKVRFFDLHSKYEKVKWVSLEAQKIKKSLKVTDLNIEDGQAKLILKNDLMVPDYKNIDYNKLKASFTLKNFPTTTALYYVKALYPVKGKFNGSVDVSLKDKDIYFKVHKGFRLDDFRLRFPGSKTPLLKNNVISADFGEVIVKGNGDVLTNFDFLFPGSRIIISGEVLNKEDYLKFKTKEGTKIDFKELGPIAGVPIKGKGPININVQGPSENVTISMKPELEGFKILGFNLGNAKGEIDYIINQDKLEVRKLNSIFNRTEIDAKGNLSFGDNPSMNLFFEKPRASYKDSLEIYSNLTKDMEFLPDDLDLDYKAKFTLTGPMNLDKLLIKGELNGGSSALYLEDINGFETKFVFKNNKIKIFDLKIMEGKGNINGSFDYNLNNNDLNYSGKISGIRLSDIEVISKANLGFEGYLEGEFQGTRKKGNLYGTNVLNVMKSTIGNITVEDSKLSISKEGSRLFASGYFLKDKITFNSFLNLNKNDYKNPSYLNLDAKSEDIKEYLGFLSTHNMMDDDLQGSLEVQFKSTFDFYDVKKFNASLDFKKLNIKKGEVDISLDENSRNILVEKGKIKKWDLLISGENNFLKFEGNGEFYNKFKLVSSFKTDATLYKVLSPKLKGVKGSTEGKVMFIGDQDEILTNILLEGELQKLSIFGIPNYFEDINFNISLENKDLLIQEFHGRYGKGEMNLAGNVLLKLPLPDVNLDYNFSNIKVPILGLKKSFLLVSGRGMLEGDKIPYDLNGKYSIVYGDLRNELNEYYPSVQSSTFYEKYLPVELTRKNIPYLNFDLDLDIISPIEMRNTLTEIFFDGNVSITGTSERPVFNGKVSVIPEKSKIIFKANEFDLLEGVLELEDTPVKNPKIKFIGTSKIKEYLVKFGVEGPTDNLSLDLSSDPFLSKEDILSLLTLGITSEDSQGLSEKERTAITSVGLGTLLADQLKINQGLSSGLGLRLSVIPEVEEDEQYSGGEAREGTINPYATRYKSATNVKVKKQITKELDLSISSTVGGSIDQRQRMSADYYINRNMSLEGVYEIKTTQDANISNISNAFGADFIFRWSFK
jgi:translocation and assembly module TamB